MKKQFWFAKKRVVGVHDSTKNATAMKLEFRAGGGLMKVASVSLVRCQEAGLKQEVLFMVGLSFLNGTVEPFVSGSVVPSCRPAFPAALSMFKAWGLR